MAFMAFVALEQEFTAAVVLGVLNGSSGSRPFGLFPPQRILRGVRTFDRSRGLFHGVVPRKSGFNTRG